MTELVASCAEAGLGNFSLLLETRADWFLRNARRFERALETAGGVGIKLSPFLVGIENFSQPELDRFNKGTTVAANVEFLETLWRWKATYGDALDLGHAAFGFVLFSPWTTLADLRANFDAVGLTRFHQFRGSILHSRARLYPETALFYLARQDDLLTDVFQQSEDNSKRYGYYPARPWRFLHPETAHFAALAVELTERTRSHDQMRLFECLLTAFESAKNYESIDAESVLRTYAASPATALSWETVSEDLRRRFETLIRPLGLSQAFSGGWRLGELRRSSSNLEVEMRHEAEEHLMVRIAPRGDGPSYRRSKHYDITVQGRDLSPSQHEALDMLCRAIVQND